VEDLIRRLALNDERAVAAVLTPSTASSTALPEKLDAKTEALVRLGAVLSSNGTTASCRLAAEQAHKAGADDTEIIGVLVAVGPAIGMARLVGVARRLALAIDVELAGDPETEDPGGW
jgi:alkylhydroperoxidase/carboxymuconolactone decarboxylase family protein YurZ